MTRSDPPTQGPKRKPMKRNMEIGGVKCKGFDLRPFAPMVIKTTQHKLIFAATAQIGKHPSHTTFDIRESESRLIFEIHQTDELKKQKGEAYWRTLFRVEIPSSALMRFKDQMKDLPNAVLAAFGKRIISAKLLRKQRYVFLPISGDYLSTTLSSMFDSRKRVLKIREDYGDSVLQSFLRSTVDANKISSCDEGIFMAFWVSPWDRRIYERGMLFKPPSGDSPFLLLSILDLLALMQLVLRGFLKDKSIKICGEFKESLRFSFFEMVATQILKNAYSPMKGWTVDEDRAFSWGKPLLVAYRGNRRGIGEVVTRADKRSIDRVLRHKSCYKATHCVVVVPQDCRLSSYFAEMVRNRKVTITPLSIENLFETVFGLAQPRQKTPEAGINL